jgi:hypothetical protein
MLAIGVRAGVMESARTDWGEVAGEEVYGLGSNPGLDSKEFNLHDEVVHLAALADIVTCAIRRPGGEPWKLAPSLPGWESGCYLSPDGSHLRRIAFVTSWNDDRHYSLCRSWESLGEICHHDLPMQMVVIVLGQHRQGRYHSYWTHGLRHPTGWKKMRFRKKQHTEIPFKESWVEIWREDHDEIKTEAWLQWMLEDDVLRDICIRVDIPALKPEARRRMVDLAQRKLNLILNAAELPMQNLSTCDWPAPCIHRDHCHAQQEPGPAYGFVKVANSGNS